MADSDSPTRVSDAARQQQFLSVVTRDEATRRFHEHLSLAPVGVEQIPLARARGRVLAANAIAAIDVPPFDRSNVDGFALLAADTVGAMEESPRLLAFNNEVLAPGQTPTIAVKAGTATTIATGGLVPRGADCVVMVEDTDVIGEGPSARLEVRRPASPGQFITFAGTDIARGETVLWAGQRITSREIGVLAAIGRDQVEVFRRPKVAVISTGDEVVPPGKELPAGCIYDSNSAIIAAAVEELGGEPIVPSAVPDVEDQLRQAVDDALRECDLVILSGGTSKGAGDLSYRVVQRFHDPGIVAHGVALKPGKPICLAVTGGKPVVILPGFPTSAIFTFHEFVAPVLRAMAGNSAEERTELLARLPHRVNSDRGRTEYLLVRLVRGESGLVAYPIGKGSGSVTTFSYADGFITIPQHTEFLEGDEPVAVTLIDRGLRPADLTVVGSHCVGLDLLLGRMRRRGRNINAVYVGSTGGLTAAKRGECDLASIHLMDPATGEYNRPYLDDRLTLIPGYVRQQCLVYRPNDPRFAGRSLDEVLRNAVTDPECVMVNRNLGSGTRVIIDRLLEQAGCVAPNFPAGFGVQTRSHNAVAAAVAQGRADWGVAIDTVARDYGLSTIFVQSEQYDFVVPNSRRETAAVTEFVELLGSDEVRSELVKLGFTPSE